MFRTRTAIVLIVMTVLLTAGVFVGVSPPIGKRILAQVEEQITRAAPLADQRMRDDSAAVIGIVNDLAGDSEFRHVLVEALPMDRRALAAGVVDGRNERLALTKMGRADFFALLDENGKVLVRNLDSANMFGEDLKKKYPSVAKAFAGQPNKDIWNFDNKMYKVGVAPVRDANGAVVGAVVVGYVMTSKSARQDHASLDAHVAYFLDGKIHASSFAIPGSEKDDGSATEDPAMSKAVAEALFNGQLAAPVLKAQQPSALLTIEIDKSDYRAIVGPASGNATSGRAGYIVIASVTDALRPLRAAQKGMIALGILAVLVMIAGVFAAARRYENGLDRLEIGASEIINGNHDFTFAASAPEFSGLAGALNVVLARLLGRRDPVREESQGGAGQLVLPILGLGGTLILGSLAALFMLGRQEGLDAADLAVLQRSVAAFDIAALVLLAAGVFALSRHYQRGLAKVEAGASELVGANPDFTFDAFVIEFEGLSNALNVMLARLLGRPEPGAEEGEGGESNPAEILTIDEPSGTPAEASTLGQEPEDAYYRRVYDEFANARRTAGEAVDGLTAESFAQKLKANEWMLRSKNKCRLVRFVVQQRGGKVTLRPVTIA
ncbi:MAG: MXAN_5187 C-terminal domain-containing protein [Myxococcota bacterium]